MPPIILSPALYHNVKQQRAECRKPARISNFLPSPHSLQNSHPHFIVLQFSFFASDLARDTKKTKMQQINSVFKEAMAGISKKALAAEWLLGSPAVEEIGRLWRILRASFIVPLLRISLYVCLVMSTMLLIEWLYIGGVVLYVKMFGRKPERRYKWEAVEDGSEMGSAAFPMVLVQIPLFNEKEVYKLSIGAACSLSWPADRLLIQVVDGSTDILIKVKSELPSSLKAFRSQQHRWSCGPNNLFGKILMDVIKSKKVTLWKKVYMIYNFFFVRKIVGHTCIFFSYCLVLPLTILIPEVNVPKGGAVFIPCIIAAINSILATPRSTVHYYNYLPLHFMSVMSLHLTKAIFTGLLGTKSANEWIVTEKLGDSTKNNTNNEPVAPKEPRSEVLRDRILLPELGFAMFLFFSGGYGFLYRNDYYFVYLFLQGITFTIVGFGLIGK
ncbi:UNVERIFIED_CONTAM: Glucomannan 4-beta-mannosyltransferase 2 [Sesamum latifolium]|uniref:Glucomannan 4-beta-mannosyltransferase 2 n=1 Tax=Sesamum latifolium TaxID=2727402 RepID=A0AAW2Y4P1_9LAMI